MMLFIIILALLVRIPGILHGNFAFTYDSARDLLAIRDLLQTRDIHLIGHTTGIIGVFYGPWWYWIMSVPFLLTGGNPVGMTLAVAIFGSLTAGFAYVWAGPVFGVLLALSPGIIQVTNQLWNPHLLVPVTLLVILLIRKDANSFLLGFFLALLAEFEIIYGVLFIIGFLLTRPKRIVSILVGMFIVEAPRILFELRNNFVQTRAFLESFGSESHWQIFTKRDWLVFDSLSSVLPGTPFIQILLSLFFGYILWRYRDRFTKIMATIIVTFWVAIFVYPRDFWPYYLFGLPVLYAVLVAKAARHLPKLFVIVYLILLIRPDTLLRSLLTPRFVGNAAVYHNQEGVVRTLFQEAESDFKYIAYTPPQIDYTWKYLFWWENKKNHPYKLSEDPPIMYVVIEPDDSYPERLNEWLRIRAKDGVIVSERKFPSGIVVQTRRLRWN